MTRPWARCQRCGPADGLCGPAGVPDLPEGTRGPGTEESSNERVRKETHPLAPLAFWASNLALLPGHVTQRHVDPA